MKCKSSNNFIVDVVTLVLSDTALFCFSVQPLDIKNLVSEKLTQLVQWFFQILPAADSTCYVSSWTIEVLKRETMLYLKTVFLQAIEIEIEQLIVRKAVLKSNQGYVLKYNWFEVASFFLSMESMKGYNQHGAEPRTICRSSWFGPILQTFKVYYIFESIKI